MNPGPSSIFCSQKRPTIRGWCWDQLNYIVYFVYHSFDTCLLTSYRVWSFEKRKSFCWLLWHFLHFPKLKENQVIFETMVLICRQSRWKIRTFWFSKWNLPCLLKLSELQCNFQSFATFKLKFNLVRKTSTCWPKLDNFDSRVYKMSELNS